MLTTTIENSVLFFKGGPTLINLLIDIPEIRISITGPKMLFDRLQLLTTLSAFDGCTFNQLKELADNLEGIIYCGSVGVLYAVINVKQVRSGGILEIDLGPASMYQSELALRTRTGENFSALIHRLLALDETLTYFVGLHAVPAEGHLEHDHGSYEGGNTGHNHSNHTGGHHGHS